MKVQFIRAVLTTPQVPRLEPTVKTESFNTPRAQGLSPEAFGLRAGEALQQVGNLGFAIVKEEREKANRTAAIKSRTDLDQLELDLSWGTEEKPGFLRKRGKDTFSITEPTLKTFEERAAEIEKSLTTPEQKEAFRSLSAQRKVEIDKQLQRHVYGEIQNYSAEANKASLESTLNNVALHFDDPERVEQERKFGLGVILTDTDTKGLPPEVIKARKDKWNSSVTEAIVSKLMIENPTKAKEYMEANADTLLPNTKASLEKQLKPLAAAQMGLDAANEIFQSDPQGGIDTLMKQMRERFKNDPSALKAGEAELKSMISERETARKGEIDTAKNEVYGYIAQVQLAGRIPKISDVPKDVWARLSKVDPEAVDQITDEIRRERESANDRAKTQASIDTLTTWGLLKGDPAALSNTNLDALLAKGRLTNDQYKDLIDDQAKLRNDRSGERAATIISNQEAVDTLLKAVGIKQKNDPEKYMKFQEKLHQRLKSHRAATGKDANQDEIVKMSRGLLAEVTQEGWINRDKPIFEIDPEKVVIPKGERDVITKALRANNRPTDEATVRQVYLEMQFRKGAK